MAKGAMCNSAPLVLKYDGEKTLLLVISSVIGGIRENLDISKPRRDFSLGLSLAKERLRDNAQLQLRGVWL